MAWRMVGATPAALSLAKFIASSLAPIVFAGKPEGKTRQGEALRLRDRVPPPRWRTKIRVAIGFRCRAALNPWQDFVISVRTAMLSQYGESCSRRERLFLSGAHSPQETAAGDGWHRGRYGKQPCAEK